MFNKNRNTALNHLKTYVKIRREALANTQHIKDITARLASVRDYILENHLDGDDIQFNQFRAARVAPIHSYRDFQERVDEMAMVASNKRS